MKDKKSWFYQLRLWLYGFVLATTLTIYMFIFQIGYLLWPLVIGWLLSSFGAVITGYEERGETDAGIHYVSGPPMPRLNAFLSGFFFGPIAAMAILVFW